MVTTPGVLRIVGLGPVPVPISDQEIEAIRRALTSNLQSEPCPFLQTGSLVHINAGPLRGIQGVFVSARGSDRVVLSVELLQRSMAVTVDRSWLSPITSSFSATQIGATRHTRH